MMYRDINQLDGSDYESPSPDPQPDNAPVGPPPYNAASVAIQHNYAATAEWQHWLYQPLNGSDRFRPHQECQATYFQRPPWNQMQNQEAPQRVSNPLYVAERDPFGQGGVAYRRRAVTSWSAITPPPPAQLLDGSNINLRTYMHHLPDILTWDPPPFITRERQWTDIQETDDEDPFGQGGVAYRRRASTSWSALTPPPLAPLLDGSNMNLRSYMHHIPDILTWDPPPFLTRERQWTDIQETDDETRVAYSPPARSVEERLVYAPLWGNSEQMPVHPPRHMPVHPPLQMPTPARSVESRSTLSSEKSTARSFQQASMRSSKSIPACSMDPPAKHPYEPPPAYLPLPHTTHMPLPPPIHTSLAPPRHTPMATPVHTHLPPPVYAPLWRNSEQMPVHPPRHMPVHPPLHMPTPARSVESRPVLSSKKSTVRSVQQSHKRSGQQRHKRSVQQHHKRSVQQPHTRSVEPPAEHPDAPPQPHSPLPPSVHIPMLPPVHTPTPLSVHTPFPSPVYEALWGHSAHIPIHRPVNIPVHPRALMPLNTTTQVPDHRTVMPLNPTVKETDGAPDLRN